MVDEPVIKFRDGVKEIQHVQRIATEVEEEQAKEQGLEWSNHMGCRDLYENPMQSP